MVVFADKILSFVHLCVHRVLYLKYLPVGFELYQYTNLSVPKCFSSSIGVPTKLNVEC